MCTYTPSLHTQCKHYTYKPKSRCALARTKKEWCPPIRYAHHSSPEMQRDWCQECVKMRVEMEERENEILELLKSYEEDPNPDPLEPWERAGIQAHISKNGRKVLSPLQTFTLDNHQCESLLPHSSHNQQDYQPHDQQQEAGNINPEQQHQHQQHQQHYQQQTEEEEENKDTTPSKPNQTKHEPTKPPRPNRPPPLASLTTGLHANYMVMRPLPRPVLVTAPPPLPASISSLVGDQVGDAANREIGMMKMKMKMKEGNKEEPGKRKTWHGFDRAVKSLPPPPPPPRTAGDRRTWDGGVEKGGGGGGGGKREGCLPM